MPFFITSFRTKSYYPVFSSIWREANDSAERLSVHRPRTYKISYRDIIYIFCIAVRNGRKDCINSTGVLHSCSLVWSLLSFCQPSVSLASFSGHFWILLRMGNVALAYVAYCKRLFFYIYFIFPACVLIFLIFVFGCANLSLLLPLLLLLSEFRNFTPELLPIVVSIVTTGLHCRFWKTLRSRVRILRFRGLQFIILLVKARWSKAMSNGLASLCRGSSRHGWGELSEWMNMSESDKRKKYHQ